jgi:hypothetical protein
VIRPTDLIKRQRSRAREETGHVRSSASSSLIQWCDFARGDRNSTLRAQMERRWKERTVDGFACAASMSCRLSWASNCIDTLREAF